MWNFRYHPKRELWFAWWVMVVFYQLYGVLFFFVTRVQPPPSPAWDTPTVVRWFDDHGLGILAGFGVVFLVAGMCAPMNALLAYSMRRMSVSRVFAYSYLIIYSLAAIPGMLVMAIAMTAAALRPDRDPEIIHWLYEFAFLSFSGTMGVFMIGSLVWLVAVLLDKNRVFPKWFGYLSLCNALTEVVVAPAWIFQRGAFAWNGAIAWWINMVVFVLYTGVFIVLLRKMIRTRGLRHRSPAGPSGQGRSRAVGFTGGGSMTNVAGADSVQQQVDEKPAKFVPGQPDMWMFVLFETLLFTGYFSVYLVSRTQDRELYLQSQADLDLRIGVFNTIALLLSSWAIARCVQAARVGAYRSAMLNAYLTISFGLVFLVSKILEWIKEIQMGNTFTSNEFFQHYFFLTSIHCIHVLIGFVVLGVVVYQLRSPARRSQQLVETCATYWHTVDFLWVLIFALLYVVR